MALLPDAFSRLLQQHAPAGPAPLCPELRLHQAEAPVPLWEAAEALAGTQLPPPFWGCAWPGGLALARYLLDHPAEVSGRRVLDFAAGGGVAGLAAARAGASSVEASELDELASLAVAANAQVNGLPVRVRCEDLLGRDEGWDVVLVGDVFYERALSDAVSLWTQGLAVRGARVLFGDPGRSFFPADRLCRLERYEVRASPAWDSVQDRAGAVWCWPG
jgi:predicted nicotinamide N-methyase